MALRIDAQLKTIITQLIELTREVYRCNYSIITDQRADFCLLLALSSAGLAEGAVDTDGKPIWVASHDLVLGC